MDRLITRFNKSKIKIKENKSPQKQKKFSWKKRRSKANLQTTKIMLKISMAINNKRLITMMKKIAAQMDQSRLFKVAGRLSRKFQLNSRTTKNTKRNG